MNILFRFFSKKYRAHYSKDFQDRINDVESSIEKVFRMILRD